MTGLQLSNIDTHKEGKVNFESRNGATREYIANIGSGYSLVGYAFRLLAQGRICVKVKKDVRHSSSSPEGNICWSGLRYQSLHPDNDCVYVH